MTPKEQQDYYDKNAKSRWLALLCVSLSLFVVILTLSATNIAIPTIAYDLQADAVAVSWIPTALIWGTMVFLLPVGRIADDKGRKKIYIIGVISFSLVSLLIFLVDRIETLLVIRVLQGFCAAMVNGTGIAIIGAVFANSNRGFALGISSSSVYLALSCGPVIGGWITEYVNWRGIFWMPIPMMLVSLLLVVFCLKGEWKSDNPKPLDWFGSVLFALWISVFLVGVSTLPSLNSIIIMLVAIGLLCTFLYQQKRTINPLVRIEVLGKNRVFSCSLIASCMMYSAHFSMIFLLSLYLQLIYGLTPTEAGKMVLIQTVIMMLLSPIAGRLSDKYEPRVIATLGCIVFAGGFLFLLCSSLYHSIKFVFLALIMLGIGFGLFSSPNNNATLGAINKASLSTASILLTLSRNFGNMLGTVGVMILMALFIGESTIEPANYPQLLLVINIAFSSSFLVVLMAAYISFNRGKIH